MQIRIGDIIHTLHKLRNISQEVLVNYLGISFQAVSKWENGDTMPNVAMIPAIASSLNYLRVNYGGKPLPLRRH